MIQASSSRAVHRRLRPWPVPSGESPCYSPTGRRSSPRPLLSVLAAAGLRLAVLVAELLRPSTSATPASRSAVRGHALSSPATSSSWLQHRQSCLRLRSRRDIAELRSICCTRPPVAPPWRQTLRRCLPIVLPSLYFNMSLFLDFIRDISSFRVVRVVLPYSVLQGTLYNITK